MRMLAVSKRLIQVYGQDQISQLSAAFAYFTLFSIGPLLLIIVSLTGFIFGKDAVTGQLAQQLTSTLGSSAAQTLQTVIAHTYQAGHGALTLALGLVSLVLGASGLFGQLRGSFNQIFQVDADPRARLHSFLWPRVKGILLIGLLSLFIIVSVALSALLTGLIRQTAPHLTVPSWNLEIVNFASTVIIIGSLLAILYKTIPEVMIPWRWAASAGIIVGGLFAIGKTILGLVIGRNNTASAYGAAAALITLLLWVFYFGQIVFMGAAAIKLYSQSHHRPLQPKPRHVRYRLSRRPL